MDAERLLTPTGPDSVNPFKPKPLDTNNRHDNNMVKTLHKTSIFNHPELGMISNPLLLSFDGSLQGAVFQYFPLSGEMKILPRALSPSANPSNINTMYIQQIASAWNQLDGKEIRTLLPVVRGKYDGQGWEKVPQDAQAIIEKTRLVPKERFDKEQEAAQWRPFKHAEYLALAVNDELTNFPPNPDFQLYMDYGIRYPHIGSYIQGYPPLFALDLYTGQIMAHSSYETNQQIDDLFFKASGRGIYVTHDNLDTLSAKSTYKREEAQSVAKTFLDIAISRYDGYFDPQAANSQNQKKLNTIADMFPALINKNRFTAASRQEAAMTFEDYLALFAKRYPPPQKTKIETLQSAFEDPFIRLNWLKRHPQGSKLVGDAEKLIHDSIMELAKEGAITAATAGLASIFHLKHLKHLTVVPKLVSLLKKVRNKYEQGIKYDQALLAAKFILTGSTTSESMEIPETPTNS